MTAYDAGGDALVDPLRRDPTIRVLPSTEHRPLRVRLHLDVSRPHELGREAARAVAPDRAPDGEEWPYFLNAADPEGNEVDLVPVVPDDRFDADAGADDWRLVFGGKVFYAGDRGPVVDLVERAAALADDAGLPVMIDVRAEGVVVDSGKDLWEAEGFAGLAGAVQEAARGLGLVAEPHRLRFVQFGLDAVDVPAVREFWRSVLGYEHDPREFLTDIVHPRLLDVPLFFQPMEADDDARRRQRGRMQLRLDVPHDHAAQRVEKALAAGGSGAPLGRGRRRAGARRPRGQRAARARRRGRRRRGAMTRPTTSRADVVGCACWRRFWRGAPATPRTTPPTAAATTTAPSTPSSGTSTSTSPGPVAVELPDGDRYVWRFSVAP